MGNKINGQYILTDGVYVFRNIPSAHPFAIINSTNSEITHEGSNANLGGTKIGVKYYHGDVIVEVTGDFGEASAHCFYHGHMGGQNIFIYSST